MVKTDVAPLSLINRGKILHSDLLIKHEDTMAEEVNKFLDIPNQKENVIFADAAYHVKKSRQERLQAPEAQVDEKDVANLHSCICDTIAKLFDKYTLTDQATARCHL